MKKLAKKLLCLTAVLALTLSLFTGCKSKNEKTLFEYAGQEVTFQEAHVYARIMQYQAEAQYGAYFGDSMWSMQVGTDSKGVRNAEKMGYKEYGTSKQPAKPVLKKAVKKSEKECLEIMQKAFEEVTK